MSLADACESRASDSKSFSPEKYLRKRRHIRAPSIGIASRTQGHNGPTDGFASCCIAIAGQCKALKDGCAAAVFFLLAVAFFGLFNKDQLVA
jgi:hypothetical protein